MHAMLEPYRRYADFQGRASRSEYWMFALFFFIVVVGIVIVRTVLVAIGGETLGYLAAAVYVLFVLGSLIPSIAVGIRRLHDTGRSAWWILIAFIPLIGSIVLLVFYCLPSTPGPNRFGPQPGKGGQDLQETFA